LLKEKMGFDAGKIGIKNEGVRGLFWVLPFTPQPTLDLSTGLFLVLIICTPFFVYIRF
jgi:hypothetical protein